MEDAAAGRMAASITSVGSALREGAMANDKINNTILSPKREEAGLIYPEEIEAFAAAGEHVCVSF